MAETSTAAEGAVPTPISTISGSDLLRFAELADAQERFIDSDEEITLSAKEDSDKGTSDTRASDESGDVEAKTEDKAEPSAEEKATLERERDEKGRFKAKSVEEKQESIDDPQTQPKQSKYADAKAREAETWKKIEAEKQAVRQQAAEIQAERDRIARERSEIERFKQIPRTPDGQPHKFNSRQYAEAADDFYALGKQALAEGDIEKSNQHFAQAEKCSQAAEQVAQAEQYLNQEQAVKQHWSVWERNMDVALQQDPSLRDPESPVSKEIATLLQDKEWGPILERIPNGFGVAAQLMKWKVSAADASALSQKNKELEAEVARLTKATSIRTSPSSGLPSAKTPDQMSKEENDALLREMIQMADAA